MIWWRLSIAIKRTQNCLKELATLKNSILVFFHRDEQVRSFPHIPPGIIRKRKVQCVKFCNRFFAWNQRHGDVIFKGVLTMSSTPCAIPSFAGLASIWRITLEEMLSPAIEQEHIDRIGMSWRAMIYNIFFVIIMTVQWVGHSSSTVYWHVHVKHTYCVTSCLRWRPLLRMAQNP